MTTRTFKQYGQGYGSTPATITVTIDGVEVFNGDVATLDQPVPDMPINPGEVIGAEVYNWTNTVSFQGTQTLQITVADGTFLMAKSLANYIKLVNPAYPNGPYSTSGSNGYQPFYYYTDGDGDTIYDPMSNVAIDGVAQNITRVDGEFGQWYWVIGPGQTLTATINVLAGWE